MGLAYTPWIQTWLMAAFHQEQGQVGSIRVGIEHAPISFLSFRVGFSTQPQKYALGAQIRYNTISVDLTADNHYLLGWTPAISINVAFLRRKANT